MGEIPLRYDDGTEDYNSPSAGSKYFKLMIPWGGGGSRESNARELEAQDSGWILVQDDATLSRTSPEPMLKQENVENTSMIPP
ncbi:hypothetical protein NDU88_004138 [Pleurodeles waltl]|uniref:Uncharacterized protein n=1 Tax=Pleurodeles waltl TaxID=8319 RepID=A0AAV7SI25_PLEWA|nr:hypothetical protein NDU88_004138 [Pleurodeles waltl]